MHNTRPYIGKELHHLPQKDIPVNNYKIIGYESHLHRSHQRGTLFFTSNVKVPHIHRQDNLIYRERNTSFASEVIP